MTGRKGRVVSNDDGSITYESRSELDVPVEILNLTEKQRFMDGEKVRKRYCGIWISKSFVISQPKFSWFGSKDQYFFPESEIQYRFLVVTNQFASMNLCSGW